MQSLIMLEETIPIWPPMAEQLLMLDKLALSKMLDDISSKAQTSTANSVPMPRPRSYTIEEAEKLPVGCQKDELVLKRNASSNRQHIILPPLSLPLEKNILKTNPSQIGVAGTWFAQDFVKNLKTMGEMRVFIDGKKTIEMIIATNFIEGDGDNMEIEVIRSLPSLQDEAR